MQNLYGLFYVSDDNFILVWGIEISKSTKSHQYLNNLADIFYK